MGTTGSGRLSDYPGSSGPKGGAGGSDKGAPGDRCGRAFGVSLEDVEQCDYYRKHGAVPSIGQRLRISQAKRVVAETEEGLSVGHLPTSHNYLAACLKDGWTYVGSVRDSSNGPPVAVVAADFGAVAPQ